MRQGNLNVNASDNSIAIGSISGVGSVNIGPTSAQVSALIAQISTTFQPKPFDGRSPYKGLAYFEEADAELFFGREKLVEDLVNRVKESPTLFVTGPSGSGKSSLVRAGLIHALKQGSIKDSERWLYGTMKPGREPIAELARVTAKLAESTKAVDEIADFVGAKNAVCAARFDSAPLAPVRRVQVGCVLCIAISMPCRAFRSGLRPAIRIDACGFKRKRFRTGLRPARVTSLWVAKEK